MTPAEKFKEMANKRSGITSDREMFKTCIAVFRKSGYWSDADIREYSEIVGEIMKAEDEDAKCAAREFWSGLGSATV
jgi:hypothetical protein